MGRALPILIGACVACALAGAASSTTRDFAQQRGSGGPIVADAYLRCLSTRTDGKTVHAGPFTGGIDPDYDVVAGRFRLHVGAYRDRATGLSQKILWSLPLSYRVGPALVVRGRRLAPPGGTFVQRLAEAGSTSTMPDKHYFPSTLRPPRPGCWRLSFRTGAARGYLVVRVDP
jgi:hypothetical protein